MGGYQGTILIVKGIYKNDDSVSRGEIYIFTPHHCSWYDDESMKRMQQFFFPCILILLVFMLYMPTLHYGFVSDDIDGIVRTMPEYSWQRVMANPYMFFFHMAGFVQFITYTLVGLQPWAYRLVNIVFHMGSVLLVYMIVFLLMRRFMKKTLISVRWMAFLAAALFAVHPIIIESVTWISGGVYAIYGMLVLLSFWLYIKGRGLEDGIMTGDRKLNIEKYLYISSIFIYSISLFFSEKVTVLFFLFFLYEWCFGNLKKHWKQLMPYFIVSCIFILFHIMQLGGRVVSVAQYTGGKGEGLSNPFIQIPVAFTSYFQLILWPNNLSLYYSEPLFTPFLYGIQLMVTFGYAAALWWSVKKNKFIFFWLLWFLIPLLPTLTPLNIAWTVAERYAYLSVIGIFVVIVYGFETLFYWCTGPAVCVSRKRPHARLIYCVFWISIIIVCFSRSYIRNQDWQNQDTLWIATARTAPLIPYTWNNMGDVYSRRGDLVTAAEMFQRAIALNPNYADAYHNLAETYWQMGEVGDAVLLYEKAIAVNPNLWQSYQSLASIYFYKKEYQKALFYIEKALDIVPKNQTLLQAREELRKMQK